MRGRLALVAITLLAVLAGPVCLPAIARTGDEGGRAEVPAAGEGRLARILQRGRLIVGVKADYAPWGMVDPETEGLIGLEPDLARDLADRLDVELDLIAVTSANRLQRLESGVVDVVIATMGDTEERRGISDLIQPHYYASGVALFARPGSVFTDWGQLRGRPVCLTQGAYFNRALEERYLVDGQVFPTNGAALLALEDGRCVGWAFDDTAIAQLERSGDYPGLTQQLAPILSTPWSVAVAAGEGDAPLGMFVADMVAEWHRTGRILALQDRWDLRRTVYLEGMQALYTATDSGGARVCRRGPDGAYPPACLSDVVARSGSGPVTVPHWALRVEAATGLDLTVLFDAYARARLAQGLATTLALSATAIVGALAVGIGLGLADRALAGPGPLAWIARAPIRAVITLARMTPPILQLYIVFFGLGSVLASSHAITPGAFFVAGVIFSFYAGATNAVLISAALAVERGRHPGAGLTACLPAALTRAFDGLVAASVNIVKAAGLASAIAVTELIATVNALITEGADAATLMNLLLVFYFLLVMGVLWLLRLAQRRLTGAARPRAEAQTWAE